MNIKEVLSLSPSPEGKCFLASWFKRQT